MKYLILGGILLVVIIPLSIAAFKLVDGDTDYKISIEGKLVLDPDNDPVLHPVSP